MRRSTRIIPKRAIFVGTEGLSERGFAGFVQHCCTNAGIRVHLQIKVGNGGDSLSVVEDAVRNLRGHSHGREFSSRLVLLDHDRLAQDQQAGRDPTGLAHSHNIQLVFQKPNLEGLFIRLHSGQERRSISAGTTSTELRKVWPEYKKPPTAQNLIRRFSLCDLQRAARYDSELQELLEIVGLKP
ncbi:MAG: hypothetical protein OXE40_01440 [Gammaproteobacteria bacterium]|nr:hypothetical protein [Gammaproteobacteria bacterium]